MARRLRDGGGERPARTLWSLPILVCFRMRLIFDYERRVVFATNPFEELEGKPTESILVGNHNLFDMSSHDVVHHP